MLKIATLVSLLAATALATIPPRVGDACEGCPMPSIMPPPPGSCPIAIGCEIKSDLTCGFYIRRCDDGKASTFDWCVGGNKCMHASLGSECAGGCDEAVATEEAYPPTYCRPYYTCKVRRDAVSGLLQCARHRKVAAFNCADSVATNFDWCNETAHQCVHTRCPQGVTQQPSCPSSLCSGKCGGYPTATCSVSPCGTCQAEWKVSGRLVECKKPGDACTGCSPRSWPLETRPTWCGRYSQCELDANLQCAEKVYGGYDCNDGDDSAASRYDYCGEKGECVHSACPAGVDQFNCFVNPCDVNTCEARPNAVCEADFCGGCNAVFRIDGEEIDCNTGCPAGVPKVQCFTDPCAVNTCVARPEATCEADYCGGCNAVFRVDGQKIDCTTGCPVGVPLAMCFADPCTVSTCAAHPEATCKANYCGGCHAEWSVDGARVEC